MNEPKQRELPFPSPKEQARLARVERLRGGKLRGKIKPASALMFNTSTAAEADRLATANRTKPYTPKKAPKCPQRQRGER